MRNPMIGEGCGAATLVRPPVDISVVIAARNEAANLGALVAEIASILDSAYAYEIVIVDDGSDDASQDVIAGLAKRHGNLLPLRHSTPCGQSAAIRTGARAATGRLLVTIDGDGQNHPSDIPKLVEAFDRAGPGIGLVIGWRQTRHDSWSKRKASRIANGIRSRILKDATPDTGCGLKVLKRETFLSLPYFDHMHRFLPALVQREGLRSESIPVRHLPRRAGRSNYGVLDRALVGIVDLMGVAWLQRRRRLPRHPAGGRTET